MATLKPHEERFSAVLSELCAHTIDVVTYIKDSGYESPNPVLIELAKLFIDNYDFKVKIEKFIEESNTHWDQILDKNEDFFIHNAGCIFSGKVSMENIDMFSSIFGLKNKKGKNVMDDESRQAFWSYLHSMVKISIKYIHDERSPYKIIENGEIIEDYNYEYVEHIDVKELSRKWKIELIFPEADPDE